MTAPGRSISSALAILLLGLVAGCSASVAHKVDADRSGPIAVPKGFGSGVGAADAQDVDHVAFWRGVGSAELDKLCTDAQAHNLDMQRARARLEAATALVSAAGAAQWPQLSFDTSVSHSQQNLYLGGGAKSATGGKPLVVTQTTFPVSVGASYEVDLWGRIASGKAAALLDAAASLEDLAAMEISVAAAVTQAWLSLVAERATMAVVQRQLDTNRKLLEAIELRFSRGLASSVDVLQQRGQLEAVQTQVPAIEARQRLAMQQLAVLLGRGPGEIEGMGETAQLPPVPALPALGVPSELLGRRPDVRAARKRMLAVDHRVAAAKADLLPSLRLSGSTGFTGRSNPLSFLDNFVFNLGAALSAPLWDGGRRKAEVARVKATLQDAVLAYGQVVQRAILDVEEALVREQGEQLGLLAAQKRVETVTKTLDDTRFRYLHGQSDYLPVLTTLITLQSLELDLLNRQRALWTARVGLLRALAGRIEDAAPGAKS